MKKRVPILLTSVCLALSCLLISCNAVQTESGFTDVPAGADYAESVAWCYERGFMQGISETAFAPDEPLTRAMIATVLYRAAGEPAVSGAPAFGDTQAGTWYSNAVVWASGSGIVQGYGNGLFGTNDSVTREQLEVLMGRYRGEEPLWTGDPALAVPATRAEVAVALYTSLTAGNDGTEFPEEDTAVTRINIQIGSRTYSATLANTQAAKALAERLPLTVSMSELNGNEKYYYMDDTLPTASRNPGSIRSGDLMLYGNNCLVLFYKSFSTSYSYTPLGHIDDPDGLAAAVGSGGVTVTFSAAEEETSSPPTGNKTLVAYFSATNTTRPLAEYAADILGADLYEIVPQEPYTAEDLKYYTDCRADREQGDPSARPAISGEIANMDDYDVVFIGYPIWHGQAPKIICTFLESYDFSGKTVVPFCTSHSSGMGSSDTNLHPLAPSANWLSGKRFAGGTSRNVMEEWITGLELPKTGGEIAAAPVFDFETKTVKLNSGCTMPINGLGTYSLTGETCVDSVKAALERGVRLIDTAHMYHNEEEVGRAIRESGVPREEIFVITKLYPGSQYSEPEKAIEDALDKLDIGYIDMMLLHHPGTNDVKAYRAMEQAVADGKIRSLGLSNWYVKELEEFLPQVSIVPALVQNEIHPYYQENDVIPYIQSLGIVTQGWYPLGGRGHTGELLGDETISAIAKAHGVSSAQVILRWNLQKGVVVIPGSSNPDHIKENTELYHFELTGEEMARINALDRGEKHDWY